MTNPSSQLTDEPLLTLDEVAELLSVKRNTLLAWRKKGTAPRAVKVGQLVRFRRNDIEAWIAEHLEAETGG